MPNASNYAHAGVAVNRGYRFRPQDIAGMIGVPFIGKVIYLDPTDGNDSTNAGNQQNDAFKTLTSAEDAATANNHEVVVVTPGGTSGTAETATVTWDKDYTHLVGNTAPVHVSQRSRIITTTDAVDPCHTISARGCIFKNLQLATFQDSNDVLVDNTGLRNYFENVHFAGIGTATAGDDATGRCMTGTAMEETLFAGCTFGLDTIARSTTNSLIEQTGTCPRNMYVDCDFNSFADNSGAISVKLVTGNCNERFVRFTRCMFNNPTVVGGATTMTAHFDTAGGGNGTIILDACGQLGATDWSDDFTAMHTINTPTIPTQATAGFMQVLA